MGSSVLGVWFGVGVRYSVGLYEAICSMTREDNT